MGTEIGRRTRQIAARLTDVGDGTTGPGASRRRPLLVIFAVATAMVVGGAMQSAQGLAPPAAIPTVASSTQFDITGFAQSAILDTPGDAHSGGTVTVNGHHVVIPRETIVQFPAAAWTWGEVFSRAPAPYGPTQSGLALSDTPAPLTTNEFHIVGNRVIDPPNVNGCTAAGGCDRYIAGLVHVSQQDLNSGAGYVSFIDYGNGELWVGGQPGVKGTGTRVLINDPANPTSASGGRFTRGVPSGVDTRFQVDQDNPTILAETGFPMCVPRVTPTASVDDPLCPQSNRPVVSSPVVDQSGITPQPNTLVAGQAYTVFRMDDPANIDNNPALCLRQPCADPRVQAPFEIGDYVTFAGNLTSDSNGQYILAHSVTASLGIYTQPGINPAYVSVDVSLIGTGGLTVFGAGEAAVRTRFEGMTTDETRMIRVYGIDVNPKTGATTDREWGTIMPDLGPPTGAVRGRWRLRPPCTASVPTTKSCTPPPAGQFIPPTAEGRAVVDGFSQFLPGTTTANPNSQVPGTTSAKTAANGLYWGQYHAPIDEYIFPENVPGTAVPENNFNTIDFLAQGGYQSVLGTQAGVLNPWPSNVAPSALVCATATIQGAPVTVANGASVKLSGTVAGTTPVTVQWTAGTTAGGTDLNGALTGATTTTPTFNSTGLAAGTYFLTLTASNICGPATDSTTITVQPAPPPTIGPIQNQSVTAGNNVTISATSTSLPAPTWTWSNPTGPAPVTFTQNPSPLTASGTSAITFNPTVAGSYTFAVTATNANGTSPVTTVTITVASSTPTNVTINPAEYRTSKQRLVLTATSTDTTVASMVLLPYLTETGTTFDPATLGNNLTVSLIAPGSFTLTLVGAPPPACNLGGVYATPCAQKPLTVKSLDSAKTVIGTSPPTALTKIRN